ncbi:MAG: hypothetical protein HKN23_15750 [Verrucomicrobiales bacterium]|nr:hypothetical protein [Verrucomicrobiales bacterium]
MKRLSFPLLTAIFLAVSLVSSGAVFGQKKKTRDEMVIEDRDHLQNDQTWIYNDLEKARAAAKAAGKPMMIVFRCIP